MRNLIVALISALFLSACGYHAGPPEALNAYQTISIPFIKNDEDGRMTATLIKTISAETGLQYERCGGDLTLVVELSEFENENIGFRYERKDDGQLKHSVIPTETRLIVVAKVTLLDTATVESLIGPVFIFANVNFDHEYEKTRNGVNVFSLGQLTDYDDATNAAYAPLFKVLSQKITDLIINYE